MTTSTATSTAKAFDLFSELGDGIHYFPGSLFFNDEVVRYDSAIVIKHGVVIGCECITGNDFRGNRECEQNIRKAIVWLLNERASSLTLDNGYIVFTPQVFNLYRYTK